MLSALGISSSGQAIHGLSVSRPATNAGAVISQAIAGSRAYQRAVGLAEAVGEPAAGEHARGPADEEDGGEELAALDQAEAEAALEHRRRPQRQAVAGRASCTTAAEAISQKLGLRATIEKVAGQRRALARRHSVARPVADDEQHDRREDDAGDAHRRGTPRASRPTAAR